MIEILLRKGVAKFVCLFIVAVLANTGFANSDVVYRINSGGKAFKDNKGQRWSRDTYFNTGKASRVSSKTAIKGTRNDTLYQSTRSQNSKRHLEYRLPVKNGTYDVRLHFAEIAKNSQGKGKRKFHIETEGRRVVAHYDPFRSAGSGFKATIKRVNNVRVTDGKLNIKLPNSKQRAFVSGIEVIAKKTTSSASKASASAKSSTKNAITITSQPSNTSVNPGQRVVMQTRAKGSSNLKYQWYFNNKKMAGETKARMVVVSADKSDAGRYHCVVRSGNKSLKTKSARLVVSGKASNATNYESATLSWYTPKRRTNGKSIRAYEISHYEVYYSSRRAKAMDLETTVDGSAGKYVASGLGKGNHYFALVAVDTKGNRSELSETIKIKVN